MTPLAKSLEASRALVAYTDGFAAGVRSRGGKSPDDPSLRPHWLRGREAGKEARETARQAYRRFLGSEP